MSTTIAAEGLLKIILEQLDRLGVSTLFLNQPLMLAAGSRKASPAAKIKAPTPTAADRPTVLQHSPRDPGKGREKRQKLAELEKQLQRCQICALSATRSKIVYGTGDPDAELVFVGEAPGADEDRKGEPFVGRAGQLLTDIIEKGMGLKRGEVYICNVVKCWPGPGNRTPTLEEMTACEPNLKAQLAVIQPKVIVALGSVAAKCLLNDPNLAITRVRGKWHTYEGIPLMPTFHPSYLLRNPPAKREVWEDIKLVIAKLNEG